MKAIRWHARGDIRLDLVDEPVSPPAGYVQREILCSGIFGTDVEGCRRGPIFIPVDAPHPLTGARTPLILGHEISGRVVAVGEGIDDLSIGDRVGVDRLMSCGRCRQFLAGRFNMCHQLAAAGVVSDGGLAERCNIPTRTCTRLPDEVPDEAGAVAGTLSVGIRELRRAHFRDGEDVSEVSAGAVGLLEAQAAGALGAGHGTVIDPLDSRRAAASAGGADLSFPRANSQPRGLIVTSCSSARASRARRRVRTERRVRPVRTGANRAKLHRHALALVGHQLPGCDRSRRQWPDRPLARRVAPHRSRRRDRPWPSCLGRPTGRAHQDPRPPVRCST